MSQFKRQGSGLCLEDLSPEGFEIVINSIADGVFTVDREFRINCFNRDADQITGVPREEAIGRLCYLSDQGQYLQDGLRIAHYTITLLRQD